MSAPAMFGWEPIAPPSSKSKVAAAVLVSATSRHGRYRPSLRISINPRHFGDDAPPSWLAAGHSVWVMRGLGDFSGQLRLAPNGPHMLRRATRGDGCGLILTALHGQPDQGAPATACAFDFSDSWFDITLPPWCVAQATPRAALPATPPAKAPPAKAPFVLGGATASHPDWVSPKGAEAHRAALAAKGNGQ